MSIDHKGGQMMRESSEVPVSPGVMLAYVVLAQAPTPVGIRLYQAGDVCDEPLVVLGLVSLADVEVWAALLGIVTKFYDRGKDGRQYVGHARVFWHGWCVQLETSELIRTGPQPLPTEVAEGLAAVVGGVR